MAERNAGRLDAMRSLVHPAVAVLAPFAFLCAIDGLVRGALLGAVVPRPAAGFRLVVLLAGAAEAVSANFLQRERLGGFGARMRELVLVLAGSGVLAVAPVGPAVPGRVLAGGLRGALAHGSRRGAVAPDPLRAHDPP